MRASRARLVVVVLGTALLGACAPSGVAPTPTLSVTPTIAASASSSASASPSASLRPTSSASASPSAEFYTQFVDVGGFQVKGSANVLPAALAEAAREFGMLVAGNAAVVNRMRDARVSVAVLAESELLTDLPEYARYRGAVLADGRAYDRLRAIGPSPCVAGEENLLHLPDDIFAGADILVHECAHAVYQFGLDASQQRRWDDIYAQSLAAGRWQGTYAATNAFEFFAELTESYLGTNAPPEAGVHNEINGAARLQAYDPRAFAFLSAVYTQSGTP